MNEQEKKELELQALKHAEIQMQNAWLNYVMAKGAYQSLLDDKYEEE